MEQALQGKEPDRVPRGELIIARELIAQLNPRLQANAFQRKKGALARLAMDFVTVMPAYPPPKPLKDGILLDIYGRRLVFNREYPTIITPAITDLKAAFTYRWPSAENFGWTELTWWRRNSDFFVFALLDGVFQGVAGLLDFHQFLLATVTDKPALTHLAQTYGRFLLSLAGQALAAGAHGLIIGDDMASARGPLVSPATLQEIFFPVYREVLQQLAAQKKPVVLHCDGNIDFLLPHLVALGFAGVHSLEPAAGMDLARVKEKYGEKLCLLGNIAPELLLRPDQAPLRRAVQEALRVGAPGGGYILSTASGSLTKEMPPANVELMYLT